MPVNADLRKKKKKWNRNTLFQKILEKYNLILENSEKKLELHPIKVFKA